MRKLYWTLLCLLGLLLSSCVNDMKGNDVNGNLTMTSTSTHQEVTIKVTDGFLTQTPIPQQNLTNTPTSATIEFSQSDVTPTSIPATIPTCKGKGKIIPAPDGFGINGTIIYYPLERLEGIYTLGGTPLKLSKIVDQTGSNSVFGFSPDGQWMAYVPIPRDTLLKSDFDWVNVELILLSDTKEQIHHNIDIKQFAEELPPEAISDGFVSDFTGWINNELMHVNLIARTPYKLENTGYFVFRPKVLDPFSGEWEIEIVNNLPEQGVTQFSFSSDLTRVLYYVPPGKLVLWNFENGRELLSKDESFSPFSIMEWAPDSSMAVVVNESRTFSGDYRVSIIARDGNVHWIEAKAKLPSIDFSPLHVAWSPDSQFIAMSNDDNLYLYDVDADSFLYMCPINYSKNLTWSPDSKYIAMGDQNAPLNLLNVETGEVIELLQFGIPLGWSASFPVEWP